MEEARPEQEKHYRDLCRRIITMLRTRLSSMNDPRATLIADQLEHIELPSLLEVDYISMFDLHRAEKTIIISPMNCEELDLELKL